VNKFDKDACYIQIFFTQIMKCEISVLITNSQTLSTFSSLLLVNGHPQHSSFSMEVSTSLTLENHLYGLFVIYHVFQKLFYQVKET